MKKILYILIGIVLLGGAFIFFRPKETSHNQTINPTPSPIVETPVPKVFTLVVKGGKLVEGPATLPVTQGDKVTIKITADVADELHLHGYDLSVDLEKDVQGELSFEAKTSGRFEYELENSHIDLGALEVNPK